MAEWKWRVRLTYNDTVTWPKVPGERAIETRHKDDLSKDMEVAAAEKRGDVNIEVTEYVDPAFPPGGALTRDEALAIIREMPRAQVHNLFRNLNR